MNRTETIKEDIINHILKKNIRYWSTHHMKNKHIKSSLPDIEEYTNPQVISMGIRELLKEGNLEKVSNRRYKVNENLFRRSK